MAQDTHIVSSFDHDLERLQAMLMRMGGLVEAALIGSLQGLQAGDVAVAEEVIENDRAVDGLDEQINVEAARILATRAPTASDLRMVLAVMRASTNLERVGDYAKNVAKRTKVLAGSSGHTAVIGTIQSMTKVVTVMLDEALSALVQRDAALAAAVRARDVEVDRIYDNLFRTLLADMAQDPATGSAIMHLHFIAKNIERAGDHATGIAEQAIYLVSGSLPAEDRPKSNAIPTDVI
jgi:phosphate transport system protein